MAVPLVRLTPTERAQLASWSFVNSYNNYRRELIDIARNTYTVTCHLLNASPTQDQVYTPYWRSLRWTNLYMIIVARKHHLPPSLHDYYAGLLARYVLEQDWADVSNAPCP
jgi:hypothetical protein